MFNSAEALPVSHYNWVRIPRVIDFELEYKDGTDEGELVVKVWAFEGFSECSKVLRRPTFPVV